jgi:hypothetical protein
MEKAWLQDIQALMLVEIWQLESSIRMTSSQCRTLQDSSTMRMSYQDPEWT